MTEAQISQYTMIMLWVHVPFATAWIGIAMLDAFLAIAPGLTTGQRAYLIRLTMPFVLISIPVIFITGIWQTVYNPVTDQEWSFQVLTDLRRTTYGMALFWKHVFVFGTMAVTLAIKLFLVRRLGESSIQIQSSGGSLAAGTGASDRLLQTGTWVNLAACLAILICVVVMVYQLH